MPFCCRFPVATETPPQSINEDRQITSSNGTFRGAEYYKRYTTSHCAFRKSSAG
jgi:hypothetical protein